jgi:hypothetical protein
MKKLNSNFENLENFDKKIKNTNNNNNINILNLNNNDNNNNQDEMNKGDWYCYMMVSDKDSNDDEDFNKPNRTILGVSQDPCYELILYNTYGPSRNSTSSPYYKNNSKIKRNSIFKEENKNNIININDINRIIPNRRLYYKSKINRKGKKKNKKGTKYKLATVISGFKKNQEDAYKFCFIWNNQSRGPIPRTAWAALLAKKFNYNIYADLKIIFSEEFKYFNLECTNNSFIIKRKKIDLSR